MKPCFLDKSDTLFIPFFAEKFGSVANSPELFFSIKRTKDWILLSIEIIGYNGTSPLDSLLWGGSWSLKLNEQQLLQTKKLGLIAPSTGLTPILVKKGYSLSLFLTNANNPGYSYFVRFIGAERK